MRRGAFERNSAYDRCIFRHIWQGGEWMLALSIALFAFATIIAWEYQEKAFEYLAGNSRRTGWYRLCYGMFAFFGAVCSLEAVWDFSDICNGLMAVPNLLAVVMLSQESAGK